MAKDKMAIIVILAIVAASVCVGVWYFNTFYQPPTTNFQVYLDGYLREDISTDVPWNSKVVYVYTDGGETFEESVTSTATGKLDFANLYWVGEEVTVQVRDDAPASIVATDPYVMPPVTFTVPAGSEDGDTVNVGVFWGRDPATSALTLTVKDQAGNAITSTSADIDLADTALTFMVSGVDSGEGWGCAKEFYDLVTGYKYIGSYIVFNSTSTQPFTNYEFLIQASNENFYLFYMGDIINDPGVPDDGQKTFVAPTSGANFVADASIMIDAYDCIKWDDALLGRMETAEVVSVAQVDTDID